MREDRRSRRFAWSDLLVAGLASAAVFALLIPSIARGRYEARNLACQEHLRQLGTAITQFVMLDRHQSLPLIAENGPEAFAGMYAVRLSESQLLDDGELRFCPEMELPVADSVDESYQSDSEEMTVIDRVVRLDDLRDAHQSAKADKLKRMQRTAGGDYALRLPWLTATVTKRLDTRGELRLRSWETLRSPALHRWMVLMYGSCVGDTGTASPICGSRMVVFGWST